MKRIREKMLLMTLLSVLSGNVSGCANLNDTTSVESIVEENNEQVENIVNKVNLEYEDKIVEKVEEIKEKEEIEEEKVEAQPLFINYDSVTATINVNIREKEIDGKILGVLKENSSLKLLEKQDNGWYKVEYYGQIGYISSEYAYESVSYDINTDIKKVLLVTEEIPLYKLDVQTGLYENLSISALQSVEVYEEYEYSYLVKVNGQIGYIDKHNLEELTGVFVVVDITDQELTLYKDSEVILKTPVVTGKPSTPTDKGLFEVYDISYTRKLIGPGYASYVDIMMKYNRGEGLHDAEYHTHEDGFSHGWRDCSEFGGDTYLKDGSHGCVNMLHDDVMKASEYINLGTKVLVKE